MRSPFLGGSGLSVSELGGTFVDTSDAFNGGLSEEIVGRWLKGRDRQSVVLSTKVRWGPAATATAWGAST